MAKPGEERSTRTPTSETSHVFEFKMNPTLQEKHKARKTENNTIQRASFFKKKKALIYVDFIILLVKRNFHMK